MNTFITRDDVPGREWYEFMNKINEYIENGSVTTPITREDVPNSEWINVYNKVNAKIAGTSTEPITREDTPNGVWFPFLSIINKKMFDVASPENVFRGARVDFATNKVTYEQFVPADYQKVYDYEASKSSLPWMIITFDKPEVGEFTVKMKHDGTDVTFNSKVESIGTLSDDGKTLTVRNAHKSLMFEVITELGVSTGENVKFEVTLGFDGEETVVEGTIAKIGE